MSEIDDLADNIGRRIGDARQAQIRFVECLSVDWENRTMDARGTADDVEYLDITLGYGFMDIRPQKGATCLIGIIEGQEVVSFLIDADVVELVEIKSDKIEYNGGENFGLVKVKELTSKLNALEKDLNTLKDVFSTWATSPGDGGASLKLASASWAGKTIPVTEQTDIENTKITH